MIDNINDSSGIVLWFTGLSGSGKTHVANGLFKLLENRNISSMVLDGDEIRSKQHSNLGFTEEDIKRNNSLIVELCLKKQLSHKVIIVPIISPYRQSRKEARDILSDSFYEIYFSASLECVKKRDVKGLYAKYERKEINNLIGVAKSNPYEPPNKPDFRINTENESVEESIKNIFNFVFNILMS